MVEWHEWLCMCISLLAVLLSFLLFFIFLFLFLLFYFIFKFVFVAQLFLHKYQRTKPATFGTHIHAYIHTYIHWQTHIICDKQKGTPWTCNDKRTEAKALPNLCWIDAYCFILFCAWSYDLIPFKQTNTHTHTHTQIKTQHCTHCTLHRNTHTHTQTDWILNTQICFELDLVFKCVHSGFYCVQFCL